MRKQKAGELALPCDTPKLEELREECKRAAARAAAITDQPVLTPLDRKHFEECLELIAEIKDYAARLQRPGERWKCRA